MIKYNPKTWFSHIFQFHKSDTLRILLPEIILLAIYATGITYVETTYFAETSIFKSTITVHSLIGFVLGLLLVFRTNTAYERWWEGRKHWGALVNISRSLAIKVKAIFREDKEIQLFFTRMISNYAFALKEHLRDKRKPEDIESRETLLPDLEKRKHLPNYIASEMYKMLKPEYEKGRISGEEFLIMDKELKSFTDITGACERIKNTPIPFTHSLFIKKVIFIYVVTLPIGLIPDFRYWSVPITVFIFYVLVSLEVIAEEIEDPFGTDSNDLPTDELAEKIRDNVAEILSD